MSTDNKNEKFVRGSDQLLRYQEDQIRRESGVTAGPDDTEFAMETTMLPMAQTSSPLTVKSYEEEADSRAPLATSKVIGYIGLIAAVISLFYWPSVIGTTAMVIGFAAFTMGARALGVWSIIIGLLSLAGYFLLVPLYVWG
jgi:hypothetical protein